MKSVTKKALIATVVTLIMIGGIFTRMTNNTKEYTFNEDIEVIEVDGKSDKIKLVLSDDDKTHVKCRKTNTIKIENNTLIIKEERDIFNFINLDNPKTTIYLPEKDYEKLIIDAVSSSIELKDRIAFNGIKVNNVSGSIDVDIDVKKSVVLSSTSGSIKLNEINCEEIGIFTVSGSIKLEDVISNSSLIIESTSGSIKLDDVDSQSIEITSVSSSIEGNFLSDKQYDISTISGSVNVPLSSGNQTCHIETVSGSIDIE